MKGSKVVLPTLSAFLQTHYKLNDDERKSTHTKIKSAELDISGGNFVIPPEELSTFYSIYYNEVFVNKKNTYLTESQTVAGNALAIDFDFRYSYDITEKQHTKEQFQQVILEYLEELQKLYVFKQDTPFNIYVFEKPHVNRNLKDKLTKDGIHMIIGIKSDYIMQCILRERMLSVLPDILKLPIINTWVTVLDEGISKGTTNWQLYGSRKPGNEAYVLTQMYNVSNTATATAKQCVFEMNEQNIITYNMSTNFEKLSVQYEHNPVFEMHPDIIEEHNRRLTKKTQIQRPASNTIINILNASNDDINTIQDADIVNKEILDRAVNIMIDKFRPEEYISANAHAFAQLLPAMYYEPGSHVLNRNVAFALKRTDERLFLSWILLRSKAEDFDYSTIPELRNTWTNHFNVNNAKGFSHRSIKYWANQHDPEGVKEIQKSSMSFYVDQAIGSTTAYDIALVLKQQHKDVYAYIPSGKRDGEWHKFEGHRWKRDKGLAIRANISTTLFEIFEAKRKEYATIHATFAPKDESNECKTNKSKLDNTQFICRMCKSTGQKECILREAAELLNNNDFVESMDANPNLIGFENGVMDFTDKMFREGFPEDYITKSTKVDYMSEEEIEKNPEDYKSIMSIMDTIFPLEDLRQYMWEHLASCTIGNTLNQTFNIYWGSGSNGKSIIVELMSRAIGDYKGVVPISWITEKRTKIGGTCDEIIKLKGVRYAVLQEASKGSILNEGLMKDISSGDDIQARGMYKESEIFTPQFTLGLCTNNLLGINSNDDGTWRRIKKIDFLAKFIDDGEEYEADTPYVFKKNKELKLLLPKIAPMFATLLVNIALKTRGIVNDCQTVKLSSAKYRRQQDSITMFIEDRLIKTGVATDIIRKRGVFQEFKTWFTNENGNSSKQMPKSDELYMCLDAKMPKCKSGGWCKVKFADLSDEIPDEFGEVS